MEFLYTQRTAQPPSLQLVSHHLKKRKGTYGWNIEGKKYIDASVGIAVNFLGHGHPKVVEAIRRQAGRLMQISNFYYSRRRLNCCSCSPIFCHESRFSCNRGGEALETALRLRVGFNIKIKKKTRSFR